MQPATSSPVRVRLAIRRSTGCVRVLMVLAILCCVSGAQGQTITQAIAALKSHITGTTPLTAAQIKTQGNAIQNSIGQVGSNSTVMTAAFDLVSTYESEVGALFVTNATKNGFARDGAGFELAQALFDLEQGIIDHTYTAANIALYESFLSGKKFNSSSYFPGAVAPPANPAAIQSAQINASQPKAYGAPVMYEDLPARRPTGCYLAPGSIATVTVPSALVNKGFTIRVGAHSWDLSAKDTLKRHDRVSLVYPITAATTKIASPLGGGIYIEVPYLKAAGVVTVQLANVVRSPFFSATSHHQTTQTEWMNSERTQPGPWADFETDKFMMQVPRDWIYNFSTPVTLMQDWDKAMDAVSELMGLPLIRSKTVMYAQPDVLYRTTVNAPGYPMSNDPYNFNTVENGNKDHYLLNGPKFSPWEVLHELGHAQLFTKFTGEIESAVNLLYVAVHNRKFGVSLGESLGRSIGDAGTKDVTLNRAIQLWILTNKFRNGQAMTDVEMKYQHRGHGKYVDIANLFGWEALDDFWHSVHVDYENGIDYPYTNSDPTDSRILRMSKAAGVDLRPLIHLWGMKPANAANLKTSIQNAGLQPSLAIYNRLKYYQTIVPMNQSEFNSFYWDIDSTGADAEFQTLFDNKSYTAALGTASVNAIQDIIDLYFPNGPPVVATNTWDISPGTVGAGNGAINIGTGTWNATAGTWTANGGANNIAWADGSNAIFGSGTYTVNLGSGMVARNLTIGAGGGEVTLKAATDNNSLTLAPDPVWTLNDNTFALVADQVNDTSLTMYGRSTLTVGGSGTFNTGEKPTGADWAVGGCTLNLTGTLTLRGNVGSVGNFATVRMPIGSTYIHERNTDQTYANDWELTGTGQVIFDNRFGRNFTLNGVISGTAGMSIGNLGVQGAVPQYLQLTNANTFTGPTTIISGGLLKLSGGANRIKSGNDIAVDGTLELNDDQVFGALTGSGSVINHGILTIGRNTTASGNSCVIGGSGSLVKTGTNTVTLSGANTYSGPTTVSGGTLSIGTTTLADGSDVYLNTGVVLNLNFTGADTIDELYMNGVRQNAGTWGGLSSSATNKSSLITGSGLLNVRNGPFQNWALLAGLDGSPGRNPAFDADPDNDGFANGLEWIFGGNPRVASTSSGPQASPTATHLRLTFTRSDDSEPGTTLIAQWSGSLTGWTGVPIGAASSGPDGNGVTVTITENTTAPDTIVVAIPRVLGNMGPLFVRLQASSR